jgi:hypothetical protein
VSGQNGGRVSLPQPAQLDLFDWSMCNTSIGVADQGFAGKCKQGGIELMHVPEFSRRHNVFGHAAPTTFNRAIGKDWSEKFVTR